MQSNHDIVDHYLYCLLRYAHYMFLISEVSFETFGRLFPLHVMVLILSS